jgi:hypothetical protein
MSDLAALLDRFRRGPEVVAAALTGAAGAEVDYRAEPDAWCVRQIVAHLADSEMVGMFRMRRIIAEDNPTIEAYDERAWSEKLDYGKRKYSAALETFRRTRAENYDLLKDLPREAFDRTGVHSERGPLTLLDLLSTYAEHAEKHAQQIQRARQAYKTFKAGA